MRQGHLHVAEKTSTTSRSVLVGADQINELTERWTDYRAIVDPQNGPVDPVEALHRTGAVLRAIEDVIVSR